jgi:hypothetical protein
MSDLGFECPICFTHTQLNVGSLDCCQHAFCFSCIETWLHSCSVCPVCKQDVRSLYHHELAEPVDGNRDVPDIHEALSKIAITQEAIAVEAKVLRSDEPDSIDGENGVELFVSLDVCEGAERASFVQLKLYGIFKLSTIARH